MNDDPELKKLLQTWQPDVELPRTFRAGVWHRIAERAEEDKLAWLKNILSRFSDFIVVPRYATALATAVVLMGLSLGYIQGNANAAVAWTQMETKYADSINPLSPNHLMANQ